MSQVPYAWVSRVTWTCHSTHEWVTSHVNESRQIWMSPCQWVMSHMHEWVVSPQHVTARMNESKSQVNESWHIWISTFEWVMSHGNESPRTEIWLGLVLHVTWTHFHVTWLIQMDLFICAMAQLHVTWTHFHVTWLIQMDLFICAMAQLHVTWTRHM